MLKSKLLKIELAISFVLLFVLLSTIWVNYYNLYMKATYQIKRISFSLLPSIISKEELKNTIIKYHRTTGLFSSSDYEIIISDGGKVEFKGNLDVKIIGVVNDTISETQMSELISAIYEIDFYNIESQIPVIDNPADWINIKYNDYYNNVSHSYYSKDFSENIDYLVNKIQSATNCSRWIN